jgi:hypothetical protein
VATRHPSRASERRQVAEDLHHREAVKLAVFEQIVAGLGFRIGISPVRQHSIPGQRRGAAFFDCEVVHRPDCHSEADIQERLSRCARRSGNKLP